MAIYRKNGKGVWYAEVYVRGVGKLVRFSTKKTDEAEAREVERAYRMAHNRSLSLDRLHAMLDTFYGAEAQPVSRGVTISDAFVRYAAQVESGGSSPAKKTMTARKGRSHASLSGEGRISLRVSTAPRSRARSQGGSPPRSTMQKGCPTRRNARSCPTSARSGMS